MIAMFNPSILPGVNACDHPSPINNSIEQHFRIHQSRVIHVEGYVDIDNYFNLLNKDIPRYVVAMNGDVISLTKVTTFYMLIMQNIKENSAM